MIPGQVAKFPALMAMSHVYLTENPADACWYRMKDPTIGRLYALYADSVAILVSCWVEVSSEGCCLRAKGHHLVPV